MGKGDKKSKKGKIAIGSYGNSRKRNALTAKLKRAAAPKKEAAASAEPEAPAKARKTPRKKSES